MGQLRVVPINRDPVFVEVGTPNAEQHNEGSGSQCPGSGITINSGGYTVLVGNDFSDEILRRVLNVLGDLTC